MVVPSCFGSRGALFEGEGIAEQISSVIFSHGTSVARGAVTITITARCMNLLLANLCAEHRQLPKGTAIAYFEITVEV